MKKSIKSFILALIPATCMLHATIVFSSQTQPPAHPGRLLVKLKSSLPAQLRTITGVKSVQHLFANHYVVQTDQLEATEKNLKNNPLTEYVERDYKGIPRELSQFAPITERVFSDKMLAKKPFNDPGYSKQWSFADANKNGISIDRAYQSNRRGVVEEVIVAVVDTGVSFDHEDLKDVMWINTKEIPGNGIDDDNNGYIDDVHGISTLDRNSDGKASGNVMDGHGHGTHVSGIIAAKQNNNIGVAGIASKARIMAIRTVPNSGDETDVDVIESFIYAAENGAKIINCSFGKSHNEGGQSVSEAIQYIGEKYGVLVIAAAGNDYGQDIDKHLTYPASFENENLMVVASTNKRGSLSFFSNIGKKNVDIAAPGSSIYSTYKNNGYASLDGTSMAAPTVAGVAAELLSNHPFLSGLELKKTLIDSVTKVSSFKNKMQSEGRIDLYQALELAKTL